jgi:hypothetical protein
LPEPTEQTLIVYHADPGSPTAQALELLSTLTADSFQGMPTGQALVNRAITSSLRQ